MLVAGAPASEVTLTIVRVAAAYGLDPVHVDVTYNSITVAHHRSGADRPITLMRVVRGAVPDHTRLQRLQSLVTAVRAGLPVDDAVEQARAIRRAPFRYAPPVVVLAQAMLAVGVAIMFGGNWLVLALSFVAAALAATTQLLLGRAHVPFFFSQIAGAFGARQDLPHAEQPPAFQLIQPARGVAVDNQAGMAARRQHARPVIHIVMYPVATRQQHRPRIRDRRARRHHAPGGFDPAGPRRRDMAAGPGRGLERAKGIQRGKRQGNGGRLVLSGTQHSNVARPRESPALTAH